MEPKATASTIINFTERLEEDSSAFYEKLARKSAEDERVLLLFAEESKKNKLLITRTYRETITDALEACFCFENLNLSSYVVDTTLTEDTGYLVALKRAIELEDKATKFYLEAAEMSKSLLATIPSAFRKAAQKRKSRKEILESLLNKASISP
jgi:rubrerythrin